MALSKEDLQAIAQEVYKLQNEGKQEPKGARAHKSATNEKQKGEGKSAPNYNKIIRYVGIIALFVFWCVVFGVTLAKLSQYL